jgi:hypothetical protein
MRHLSSRAMWNCIEGKVTGSEKLKAETHLAACAPCCEEKQDLEYLCLTLTNDHSYEPPADWCQRVRDAFRKAHDQHDQPENSRGKAEPLPGNTLDDPTLANVIRRFGARPRQLVYRADDVDIDLRIESTPANRINLEGQVLSSANLFENVPVKLESHGIVRYQTRTNEIGEFSFDEVPRDTYHLSVDLAESQLMVFCVPGANC